jgi:tetratricopeptide (TPR) repeat protein
MFGFDQTRSYDRARILEAAMQAKAHKKRGQAIALYRRILALEPSNPEIHLRVAPLLAETGQSFDAWVSYRTAAQASLRERRGDKALAIYREAAAYLPREVDVWLSIARIHLKRGRRRDAVESLIEGACQFRSRFTWPEAIHLLRRAHEIAPWDFEAVFELARLLARSGQREEARRFLDGLLVRCQGERARRVYAAQFRLDGDVRVAWRWLCAVLRGDGDGDAAETSYG